MYFKADAALFAILVQFFETPLNTIQLKHFFSLKGEEKGKKIVGEIEEEDDASTSFKKEKEYSDKRIQILYNFVEYMKEKLGFSKEIWNKLKTKPWTFNFMKDRNLEADVKYEGK